MLQKMHLQKNYNTWLRFYYWNMIILYHMYLVIILNFVADTFKNDFLLTILSEKCVNCIVFSNDYYKKLKIHDGNFITGINKGDA